MEFQHENNRIYMEDAKGRIIAEVTFPAVKEQVVNINHTFVDESLRGQGVAGKLMEEAAAQLRKEGKKAVLTCSYALVWFERNKQYQDIIEKP